MNLPKMPGEGKRELVFQDHIRKSYERQGGYARKWASAWTAGPPDLVCSLPGFGVHLMEVKHLPTWKGGPINNPMTTLQQGESEKIEAAGGVALLGVVYGSSVARGSFLGLFQSSLETFSLTDAEAVAPYVVGEGFDIRYLLAVARTRRAKRQSEDERERL